jgi:Zn-finger nucleic acid-binding protein
VFAPRDTCICGEACYAWTAATPEQLACPRWQGKLERVGFEGGAVHVEQCARCLGCFVRTEEFSELVERESLAGASGREPAAPVVAPPTPLPRQVLLEEIHCPHCAGMMERARFAQHASIVIDVCAKHGAWLDAGELAQVVEHVQRTAAGTAEPSAVDLADEAHWDRVLEARRAEERRVEAGLSFALAMARRSRVE